MNADKLKLTGILLITISTSGIACAADAMTLATADKIGAVDTHVVAPASTLTRVVTSTAAGKSGTSRLARLGLEVVRVEVTANGR